MSGIYNGVQSIIKSENNLAYYTHCGAHRVNLIAHKISNQKCIRESLSTINGIANLFSKTIKFRNIFIMKGSTIKLNPMCPTRWTVRKDSIKY